MTEYKHPYEGYEKPKSDPVRDYYDGASGNPLASGWGQVGYNDYKKNNPNSKVICTELMRQGLYNKQDYLLGARYVGENLSQSHVNGYHSWALPVVRKMRKSKFWTKFFHILANSRADHIAHFYGDKSRRNLFGRILCVIGEPACLLIGKISGPQNWNSLYSEKEKI